MHLARYRLYFVIAFLGIFTSKMIISGAPVFFSQLDKNLMNDVIMQLESENHGDESGKSVAKFQDHKMMYHRYDVSISTLLIDKGIKNSFIEHFRRYVDPFHPTVPTPPPNFS